MSQHSITPKDFLPTKNDFIDSYKSLFPQGEYWKNIYNKDTDIYKLITQIATHKYNNLQEVFNIFEGLFLHNDVYLDDFCELYELPDFIFTDLSTPQKKRNAIILKRSIKKVVTKQQVEDFLTLVGYPVKIYYLSELFSGGYDVAKYGLSLYDQTKQDLARMKFIYIISVDPTLYTESIYDKGLYDVATYQDNLLKDILTFIKKFFKVYMPSNYLPIAVPIKIDIQDSASIINAWNHPIYGIRKQYR